MSWSRSMRAACAVLAIGFLTSGCSWTGLNSMSLPFTKGHGSDAVQITVQLANAANLVPNSEVKYDEVTVGSVRKIELKNWTATLTVGLEKDAMIPADVTATIAQKSLLGAEYVALADPKHTRGSTPKIGGPGSARVGGSPSVLQTGDVIPLSRTARYPETEEVLSAGALLFNDGGLPQVRSIAHELNAALGGHSGDIRSFMRTVTTFTGRLDAQRKNIVATLGQLNRLGKNVEGSKPQLDKALSELPAGIKVISDERRFLVAALRKINVSAADIVRFAKGNKVGLQRNLDQLRPVITQLAQHGDVIGEDLDALTFPFNVRATKNILGGDFINFIGDINVDAGSIASNWLGGTPVDGLLNGIIKGSPVGPAGQAGNPLGGLLGGLLGGPRSSTASAPSSGARGTGTTATGKNPLGQLVGNLLGGH